MAKKSNKTEQVLKLLTKEEDEQISEVEVSVKPKETQELTYEAKLKIEIDPEVTIKEEEVPQAPVAEVPIEPALTAAPATAIPETAPVTPEPKGAGDKAESELFRRAAHHLVNLAEIFVLEKVDDVMKRLGVCDCPVCRNDVLAMSLNGLPTQYVTTDMGKQYLQLEAYKKQYETDVIAALTKACVRVKAAPRHGE